LKEAIAQFDGGATVKGDILLDGNINAWKKFANSLRMIMAFVFLQLMLQKENRIS
jgi:hypothetical protein